MDQQTPAAAAGTPAANESPQQQPRTPPPPSAPPQPPNPNTNHQPPPSRPPSSAAMMAGPTLAGRPHSQGFPRTTWQHPHFSPFSSSTSSSPAPSLPASAPSASRAPGGMAIGVPASTAPYPSSFGQQHFGALARPEPVSPAGSSQARPGMQGMGMMGSMNSSPQIRPGAVANPHHPRPVQSGMRPSPSTSSAPSPAPQSFQGHGFVQSQSGGPSTSSPAPPNAAKGMPAPRQPWMAPAPQGRPPLPPPLLRPQMTSSQGHPRSITAQLQQQQQSLSSMPQQQQQALSSTPQQQQQSLSSTPQQQQQSLSSTPQQQQQHGVSTQPQPSLPSHQPSEHHAQQFPPSKLPQASPQQQQVVRVQGSASQKQASPAKMQANTVHPVVQNKAIIECDGSGARMLSKRTIHELVSQIDPLERLDPDVEDILTDIADDFVESITTFGCSLAKHRKSDRLEAKDILLHVEKNWNIALPGFGADEIKTYRKPFVNDIHKERLAAIKKSVLVSDTVNAKNTVAQVAGNAKTNQSKAPASALLSPK